MTLIQKPWYRSKTLWVNIIGALAMALQSELGYLLPPQYQALALAVANAALRLVTGSAIDPGSFKVKLPPRASCWLVALGLACAPVFSGCALVKTAEERPVLTELAVRAAVGRALDAKPEWVGPARDLSAAAIKLLEEPGEVDLAGLERYVLDRIAWEKLTPEEEELLRLLLRAIRDEALAYLEAQGVAAPEEVAVRVATVLGWIYQSAELRAHRLEAAHER